MVALHPHTLPRSLLRRLCEGDDDLDDSALLVRGRLSKNALLLRIVRDLAAGEPGAEMFRDHLAALTTLQRTHPGAVARVLTGPHFGAWATHCMRRLTGETPADDTAPPAVHLGGLGGFVGVAAIRSGADIVVSVPVRDGAVVLPGAGSVPVPGTPTSGWATLRCRAGRVRLDAAGTTATDWRPFATLHSGLAAGGGWAVTVDAEDPYLRFFEPLRAADVDIPRWSRRFGTACAAVDGLYARKLTAMARSISCLVPVAAEGAEIGLSATSAAAAGAVVLTEPSSAIGLAATLVHEHQHLKLNALHDLVPLFDDDGGARFYSPWRNDPRPTSGLLHGVYAFLGVGDFWLRTCRQRSTGPRWGAHLELARITGQLSLVCDTLARCSDLTEVGSELVTHLTRQARQWRVHDPPRDVERVAGDVIAEHQVRWRLRHLTPSAAETRRLAVEQIGPRPRPQVTEPSTESSPPAYGTESGLAAAAKRWAAGERPASLVDQLILAGRYAMAQSLLMGRIRARATPADWICLAVVARHTDLARRCPPLRTHPELAYALYRELQHRQMPASLASVARCLSAVGSRYVAGTSISLSARM